MLNQHRARKRFGQHFLIDPIIIDTIIGHINPQKEQFIIEIGPGHGALTESLLQAQSTLTAIEIDRNLIQQLQIKFGHYHRFTLLNQDALRVDYLHLQKTTNAQQALRIVGNLPYNIATPLLLRLLPLESSISDMCFMLQKEVVERLIAEPSSPQRGRLSVITQYYTEVESLLDVPAHAFSPRPQVESAIVRIKFRPPPWQIDDIKLFNDLINLAFSQRRKTIKNNLSTLLNQQTLCQLDIDPMCRAENLSVEDYVRLSNYLSD